MADAYDVQNLTAYLCCVCHHVLCMEVTHKIQQHERETESK